MEGERGRRKGEERERREKGIEWRGKGGLEGRKQGRQGQRRRRGTEGNGGDFDPSQIVPTQCTPVEENKICYMQTLFICFFISYACTG